MLSVARGSIAVGSVTIVFDMASSSKQIILKKVLSLVLVSKVLVSFWCFVAVYMIHCSQLVVLRSCLL